MNKILRIIFLNIALVLWPKFLHAEIMAFDLERGNISISIPQNWQHVRDLFGMPLTLLGPSQNKEARPIVTFTPTGIGELSFDSKNLKTNEESYRIGREDWLSRRAGKSLEYFSYQFKKESAEMEVHQIGFKYAINDVEFVEHSYFILCKHKLYHAKTLIKANQESLFGATMSEIVKSFQCK